MQLVKIETTQAQALLPALREGNNLAISKAVMKMRTEQVEKVREQRRELEKEVEYLRIQYKNASLEKRPAIEAEARALIATIETMPEFPPLTALARQTNTQDVLDDMCILLAWMNDQLNIANKLNADQVEVTAVTILGEYGHILGMEDIAACLRKALAGVYGQIYARLDAAVIMDWLQRYEQDLMNDRMNRTEARHANLKESRHDPRGAEYGERDKNRAALAEYLRSNQ
jgi:hypothetical protein